MSDAKDILTKAQAAKLLAETKALQMQQGELITRAEAEAREAAAVARAVKEIAEGLKGLSDFLIEFKLIQPKSRAMVNKWLKSTIKERAEKAAKE